MTDGGGSGSREQSDDPYKRRHRYETEVDGLSGRTPTDLAAGVGVAILALVLFGFFQLAQWIAFPGAAVVALVVWQLLAALRRRREQRNDRRQ
jgi:hypothetical protein